MKTLKESLFDKDLVKSPIHTLFSIAKDHVYGFKRYEYTNNSIQKFINQPELMRAWKKSGSPLLNETYILNTSLTPYENKVVSTILDHMIVNKKGEIDNDELNQWLEKNDILKPIQALTSTGKSIDLNTVYAEIYFVDPHEEGAWMHKNFKNGPIEKECYEIDIQFRYKDRRGLALSFEFCLNIKWSQMDALLGK